MRNRQKARSGGWKIFWMTEYVQKYKINKDIWYVVPCGEAYFKEAR